MRDLPLTPLQKIRYIVDNTRGLNMSILADLLGLARPRLYEAIAGAYGFRDDPRPRIAEALGVLTDDIWPASAVQHAPSVPRRTATDNDSPEARG